jgi:hypothetical protein
VGGSGHRTFVSNFCEISLEINYIYHFHWGWWWGHFGHLVLYLISKILFYLFIYF